MTKYFKLVSTVSRLEVFVKIDEWNGDKITYYPCCTLYNGTIVYNIIDNDKVIKKVFDRKYMSINTVTMEVEITENEWDKMLSEI